MSVKIPDARTLVALALALSPLSLCAPAQAHDGSETSCVTRHEWRHARIGVRKARVHRIFDTRGRYASNFAGGYTRKYKPCAWGGGTDVRLYVSYDGYTTKVVEKRVV